MQQLNCPNCGATVPAENINIQALMAVCSQCDTVFRFDTAVEVATKAKRRKVHKPQHLQFHDGDPLTMAFRTNFRLDQDQDVMSALVIGLVLSLTSVMMMGGSLADGELVPFLFALGFLAGGGAGFYRLATRVYNKTHISMDERGITVERAPLATLRQAETISLYEVTAIKCEETEISQLEGYDTPRYRVYAERADGSQRLIVTDMIEDYGYFIAQRLQARLDELNDVAIDRLVDDYPAVDATRVDVDTAHERASNA